MIRARFPKDTIMGSRPVRGAVAAGRGKGFGLSLDQRDIWLMARPAAVRNPRCMRLAITRGRGSREDPIEPEIYSSRDEEGSSSRSEYRYTFREISIEDLATPENVARIALPLAAALGVAAVVGPLIAAAMATMLAIGGVISAGMFVSSFFFLPIAVVALG